MSLLECIFLVRSTNIALSLELDTGEQVLSMKAVNLETSETTHQRKTFLAAGTVMIKGEDLAARGNILVLDVIDVVPEPDRPETNRKLKVYASEEVKGAVTALSEIGAQGFLLVTHGQKCMVRGLKEDQTLLPVAFMDMQCYVTVAKTLKGTGMVVMGDIAKGVWFTGYTVSTFYFFPILLQYFGALTDLLILRIGGALQDDAVRKGRIEDGGYGRRVSSSRETALYSSC
jgi:hypothetical protein